MAVVYRYFVTYIFFNIFRSNSLVRSVSGVESSKKQSENRVEQTHRY